MMVNDMSCGEIQTAVQESLVKLQSQKVLNSTEGHA